MVNQQWVDLNGYKTSSDGAEHFAKNRSKIASVAFEFINLSHPFLYIYIDKYSIYSPTNYGVMLLLFINFHRSIKNRITLTSRDTNTGMTLFNRIHLSFVLSVISLDNIRNG